ncbi:D-alanyl-D-alanine carboxypeptidase/D-alanyl-D-alanine-endopeptidase [Kitasatospora sp. NPDC051853]|uniref:D-alanyl-D-alanine carboxypeptidase/D-alanyl-D-alanine endopeptidase n=1 Tax=Kitasatospora sp. NPDC051853 TaxID=3364058 RepID=UPI00379B8B6B
MQRGTGVRRGRRAAVAGVLGVALTAGGLTAASAAPSPKAGQSSGHPSAPASGAARPPAPAGPKLAATGGAVLAASVTGDTGLPTTAGLQRDLGALLQDKAFGTLGFAITDGVTGALLLGGNENGAATPASTTKLLTAVAALQLVPGDTRLSTRVVQGSAPDEIVLVGGGDPTLSTLPQADVRVGGMPVDEDTAPATLADLAQRTAAALKTAGVGSVKIGFDTSLYTGPIRHAEHDGTNIADVTPLMVDEAKIDPRSKEDAPGRVAEPAVRATEAFAALLGGLGITVQGKPAAKTAAAGAAELAAVKSPTIDRLVERFLTTSDNLLTETIARQVAIAAKQPASFEGASLATRQTLEALGVPMTGVVLNDGSGLHKGNQLSPLVLAKLLAVASSPEHPQLRPVLTGLPIAGFTGTMASRFAKSPEGIGIVRAKTGTLTESGIFTLAGTVMDAEGRPLTFALMSHTTPTGGDAARAAIDRAVARLAVCGCH